MAKRAKRSAPKKGARAAIYARYSSHNQRGESIEIQLDNDYAYCHEHELEVVKVYIDEAKTGRDTNRADFQQMLEDAKRHLMDYVVIYKVPRIMRNRDEMAFARIMLRKCGVEILYAGEQIAEGSSGVLQLGMLEVLAEWESAVDSERITEGIAKNAERCMANGQRLYGWDIVDGFYALNEQQATVMRMMKDMLLSGSMIADIRRACEPYRTQFGNKFTQSAITKMLKRKQNAGIYVYAGYEIPGGMPALWSLEEQQMIWKILEKNARPRKRENTENYALTGKLFCGKCKTPMIGTSGTSKAGARYYYYRCKKCRRNVRKDIIEANVADDVIAALSDEATREKIADMVAEIEQDTGAKPQSEIIRSELHDIELSFDRIWQAIEGGYAPPGGKERVKELTKRKELLEDELRVAVSIESVTVDRNRILFWLEDIAQEEDPETLIEVFVSKVVLVGDDDLHIAFTFEGGDDDIGQIVDDSGGVRVNGPELHHGTNIRTQQTFGFYALWRGFVIVGKYEKSPYH